MMDDAWLSAALGRAVSGGVLTRIGEDEGFTGGGIFRVAFQGGAVVAKLSPTDVKLRETFAQANAREVAFYQMAGAQNLPVPKCEFGAFDARSGASALLIEDIGAARQIKFIDGCSSVAAGLAIDALARIHGAFWRSDAIDGLDSLGLLAEYDFAAAWDQYPKCVAQILPDVILPDGFLEFGSYLAANLEPVFSALWASGPLTCLHRDAQVDNVLLGGDGAVWLDWQFAGKGRGVCDLSFFIASSLEPDVRRESEDVLKARYHRGLVDRGVTDYPMAQLHRDYAVSVAGRLFITVMASVLLDNTPDHRRRWRRSDLRRLLAFFEDHQLSADSLSEWVTGLS